MKGFIKKYEPVYSSYSTGKSSIQRKRNRRYGKKKMKNILRKEFGY